MTDLQFGFSLTPTTDISLHHDLVTAAEEDGLDLVGIQDHPYASTLLDTFSLMSTLLVPTNRLRFFPDVTNLPLRQPAVLANMAASLDLLSGGRFELGIGAGGYWDAISRFGVPRLTTAQALDAMEEAMNVMRALWQQDTIVRLKGDYHSVDGVQAGPAPAHRINIWIGAQGPRSLRLTGRIGDGWAAPIPSYLPYEKWAEANAIIDAAAGAAGRDPADVLRMSQLVGTVTDRRGDAEARVGSAPVRGTPDQWAELIARLATEQPYRAFIFWPEAQSVEQVQRFAREVVPAARRLVDAAEPAS
ncbi:LLM class flavin-dependent oxidoreductase [Streptomyces griseus]|uniref:LLM class flavin-dependent oxidoreductase n=1 Tax=Streptomyces griseus TaxID=1911 RepID=UPI000563DB3D|nr:LLM class flavin-dependent oxidoreductase [Streptomyces griseus]